MSMFYDNNVSISEGNFIENFSIENGGGIDADSENVLVINSVNFSSNAADSGGAVFMRSNNTLTLRDSSMDFNSAEARGGALCFVNRSDVIMDGRIVIE